jgi:hypothetical protein
VRVQKVFNGYLRIKNENFLDAYENSNSTEFINLANKVKEAVSLRGGEAELSPAVCLAPPGKDHFSSSLRLRSLGWGVAYRREAHVPGGEGAIWAWGSSHYCPLACHEPCPFSQLKLLYSEVPVLGPYHKKSAVTAFR